MLLGKIISANIQTLRICRHQKVLLPTVSQCRLLSKDNHQSSYTSRKTSSTSSGNTSSLFDIDGPCSPERFCQLKEQSIDDAEHIVEQIVNYDGKRNLVGLFDELSNCLCKVADLAEFVRVSHPKVSFRDAAEDASIAISSLVEKLNTDRRLYNALKNANFEDPLDDYVSKLFQFDFEQCGIHLNDAERTQVLHLNETILRLGSIFTANASQARLIDKNQLPPSLRSSISISSKTDAVILKSLHADSENEEVREAGYRLFLQPDANQDETLTKLLDCRLGLARLCGFPSYAHRAVKGSITGTPEVVVEFLDILNDQLKDLANRDYQQMLSLKLRDPTRTSNQLNAWDVPYYNSSYKRHLYDEKLTQCLPYFSVGVCMEGLNVIFSNLYGIRMEVDQSQPRGELWHEEVIKLSIIDETSNDIMGYIYCDLFERPMKQQQDCHHTIRGGCYLPDGSYQLPVVVLMLSMSRTNNPALLAPSMVDNLFHEMGHAMHSMMARTKYQHITGTRCSTDLAEVPSILMEYFVSDARVLAKFARHYKTGQPMPSELMQCWCQSKTVFLASETQLQLFYAALDQAYHGKAFESALASGRHIHSDGSCTTQILAKVQQEYYSLPYIEGTAWQHRFSHLVGYGAKYYSYLVSRAVASAIWRKLFQQDPLSREAGTKYMNQVLAHGGGKAANAIASDVLGCKVDAQYLASSLMTSIRNPAAN